MEDMTRACRICELQKQLPGNTAEYINRFIAVIPPKERADKELYEARLRQCETCDKLSQVTCLSCGCYVQMRAAVKEQHCPKHQW